MRRLYAHRGAAAEEPENTLPGFALAVSYGADALELDVHMTSDGKIVVSHDSDGMRMCNRTAKIRRTTYAELSQWDAGWGFVDSDRQRPFADKGYRIPLFAEILDQFPDKVINVDLKQRSPSMVSRMLQIVRQAGAEERVILASFSQYTLLHVRAAGYRGLTALAPGDLALALYLPKPLGSRLPLRGQAAQIPVQQGPISLATPEKIAKLHGLGLRVDFWTINDVQEARRLLAMGADGIMTDDPKRIAAAFSEY
ncbi:MAG: glycerophosphodiester phosphodiesterase [Kofleriaceae bacterium]|nr:glycerophosphodiester phosphodiesterase [Kofleriaceae bacterium]